MLTAANIATIQSALDTLATLSPRTLGCGIRPPAEFKILAITISVRWSLRRGNRWETPIYTAKCDLDCLSTYAEGHTRLAALRNLFKALRNAATWNAPTLTVPLMLCEPTKARAQARAERKAKATIIGPAPEFRAVDSHDDGKQVQIGGYSRIVCTNTLGSASRFVEAPIIPADAAPGSEGIFKALLGLRTEQKIVALANALQHAGVTICRVEEDGAPIIRASTPDRGTATVLNL